MLTKREEHIIKERKGFYFCFGLFFIGYLGQFLKVVFCQYPNAQLLEVDMRWLGALGVLGLTLLTFFIVKLYKIIIKLKTAQSKGAV